MSQDITGKSKGNGKAWVGAGPDREAERAAADAAAAARSPELAAELAAEHEHGRRLMAIGARMAGKAERALRATVEGRSGRMFVASEASIADATADATAALVFALRRHADGSGVDWSNGRVRRRLCLTAWRAAYRSLTERAGGFTGRHGSRPVVVPLSAAELQVERVALAEWAERGPELQSERPESSAESAAREASAWVWDVLTSGANAAEGAGCVKVRASARARAVLVIRLIHGDDATTAARAAGFSTWASAAKSIRSGRVFETLAVAARGHAERVQAVRVARSAARAAGLRVADAVKRQRRALVVRAAVAVMSARARLIAERAATAATAAEDLAAARRRLQRVRGGASWRVVRVAMAAARGSWLAERAAVVAWRRAVAALPRRTAGRRVRAVADLVAAVGRDWATAATERGAAVQAARGAAKRALGVRVMLAAEFKACVKGLFSARE